MSTVGTCANFTSPVALLESLVAGTKLYCSKGVLNTSFCLSELIPLADGSPISLENWRQAPKVSLHNVARDPTMVERYNCHVSICSGSIVISSASEEEHEVPDLWVNNGAYRLTHCDQEVVLSPTGWLTDEIICAAQMLLLQFFPNMAGLQPPILQKVLEVHVHSGGGGGGGLFRLCMSETTTGVWCPQLAVKVV